MYTGDHLDLKEICRPGDYIFVPPQVPHVVVNRGETPAVFVGARNESTAKESVAHASRAERPRAVAHDCRSA